MYDRQYWDGMRELVGITTVPVLRPDGSIRDEEGYDGGTGLLYCPGGDQVRVPQNPTQEQAKSACEELLSVISDFPFSSDNARSGWLSIVLAGLGWPSFEGNAPFRKLSLPFGH